MGEFSTKGIQLSVATVSDSPNYKALYGLFNVPEMGGTPEMIDVTNLDDSARRSIPGLASTTSQDFEFYAMMDEEDSSEQIRDTWNILRGYQVAETPLMWKLEYPDGNGFTWKGKCSVRRQAASVNDAVKFTLTVGMESPLEDL